MKNFQNAVYFILISGMLAAHAENDSLKVLYLGGGNGHKYNNFFQVLVDSLPSKIQWHFSESATTLHPDTLQQFHTMLFYHNIKKGTEDQIQAMLDYIRAGGGLVAVHWASGFAFKESEEYTKLIGARFKEHGKEVFSPKTILPEHPAISGVPSFTAWDETYRHKEFTNDRTVLQVREEEEGGSEDWTWVRQEGEGKVYYTASGHDDRVWKQSGFLKQIEKALYWSSNKSGATGLKKNPQEKVTTKKGNVFRGSRFGTEDVNDLLGRTLPVQNPGDVR